ncbi:MAG: hypothetical protein Q7K26_05115 [bacterium]|nr:hypothetical protein [bacterium]
MKVIVRVLKFFFFFFVLWVLLVVGLAWLGNRGYLPFVTGRMGVLPLVAYMLVLPTFLVISLYLGFNRLVGKVHKIKVGRINNSEKITN